MRKTVLLFLMLFSAAYGAMGQGTSCSNATSVTPGSYTAPQPNSWYTFVPTQPGIYRIYTCQQSSCDTKIYVYDYCVGLNPTENNLATVLYNDDACSLQSEVQGILQPGTTYYIRIDDYNNQCNGQTINWTLQYIGQISGCTDPNACNYNPEATLDNGSCVYAPSPLCPTPDLTVVQSAMESSLSMDTRNADQCSVEEGCLNGYGLRDIIRFTTHIKNVGNADYYIGQANPSNPQFDYINCHQHAHYVGYAKYELYDLNGNEIPIGFKNGFCVMDLECSGGGSSQYGCGNMGISHGCGDIYGAGLDCQWVDITDVDTGTYHLVIKVNWDHSPDYTGKYETSYDNNFASVCIRLARDAQGIPSFSVVQGCVPVVDCMGVQFGNAQTDCNGVCNGTAIRGDMNSDLALDQSDASLYNQNLISGNLQQVICNDMDADGTWTVHDAALINNCSLNEHPINNPCDWPFGITNNQQTSELSIIGYNWNQQYIDIGIKNATHSVLAYQFRVSGIEIQSAQNLANPLQYNITPQFQVNGTEVIGMSYQEMKLDTSAVLQPLVRLFFNNITAEQICIDTIVDIVNSRYEATLKTITGNCLISPYASVTEYNKALQAEIFPNPASDLLNIKVSAVQAGEIRMRILDVSGRVVRTAEWNGSAEHTETLNIQSFADGLYTLELDFDGGKVAKKFLVKK